MNTTQTPSPSLPKGRILFVDDDPALLKGLERSLRSTREAWQCEFVDSPAAALDLLQQAQFQVVVSDMQMPGMDGAEFLASAREISPDTVRVMLTGNADLPTAMAAGNHGHVFQFLLKPCEGDRLVQSVAAALLQHRLQIAERELLLVRLENSEKMVTIGQLAAGITHDLNNILGAILMQSELELHDAHQNPTARPAFSLIHEAATSAAALTRELNSFSRGGRIGGVQELDVSALIEAGLRIIRPLLKPQIKLRLELTPGLPPVPADAGKLKQALMNLLLNARDAMPTGGEVTIVTKACCFTASDQCVAHPQRRAGAFVCISVQDSGSGIDTEIQAQIFQPFFTTKGQDKGSGLGLFMVQRVVTEHNGWVELDSAPGQGTTFRLYLPVREKSEPREAA